MLKNSICYFNLNPLFLHTHTGTHDNMLSNLKANYTARNPLNSGTLREPCPASFQCELIANRCSGFSKNIIVVHAFFLRNIFRQLSKVKCECKHCGTPGLPGDISAIKIRIFYDQFIVPIFLIVVHCPQRNIDLILKYFIVECHIVPGAKRISHLNGLRFSP